MSTGLCGSEPYIAPEQFTQKSTYVLRACIPSLNDGLCSL